MKEVDNHSSVVLITFQVLSSHMELVAIVLDRADRERGHHHRKL